MYIKKSGKLFRLAALAWLIQNCKYRPIQHRPHRRRARASAGTSRRREPGSGTTLKSTLSYQKEEPGVLTLSPRRISFRSKPEPVLILRLPKVAGLETSTLSI